MKLSVSLPDKDVEFLDYYITLHDLESRSAALQAALKALRDLDLQDQYEQAFSEEERYEDPEILERWHKIAEVERERRRQVDEKVKNATW